MAIYDERMVEVMKTIKNASEQEFVVLEAFFQDRRDSLDKAKMLEFTLNEPVSWQDSDGKRQTGVVEDRNKRSLSVSPDGKEETVNVKPVELTSLLAEGDDEEGEQGNKDDVSSPETPNSGD